jgi:nucleotide-binding universal stress UspA family protein
MMAFRRPRAVRSGTGPVHAAAAARRAGQAAAGQLAGQDSGPVLVGVDGRARGWDALEWAAAEAAARQCTLRVVHVINWPCLMPESFAGVSAAQWDAGAQQAAEFVLSEAARRARVIAPALRVTTHLQAGAIAAAIVEASDRDALIVVGRGREAGRLRSLTSPVSWQVARHASGPVAVVGLSGEASHGPSAGRVVVGVGGTADPAAALGFAFRAARRRSVGLTVLHARGPRDFAGRGELAAGNGLDDTAEAALLMGRDLFPDVAVRMRHVAGLAGSALVAESAAAALVVLGSRARGRLYRTRSGSPVRDVLRAARSPVAIARVPDTAPDYWRSGNG